MPFSDETVPYHGLPGGRNFPMVIFIHAAARRVGGAGFAENSNGVPGLKKVFGDDPVIRKKLEIPGPCPMQLLPSVNRASDRVNKCMIRGHQSAQAVYIMSIDPVDELMYKVHFGVLLRLKSEARIALKNAQKNIHFQVL